MRAQKSKVTSRISLSLCVCALKSGSINTIYYMNLRTYL